MKSLQQRIPDLTEGIADIGHSATSFATAGTSDVTFAFDQLTVGFVLSPVMSHRAAYGSDRQRDVPLSSGTGWMIDAGADGRCTWDGDSAFLNVHIDRSVLSEISGGRNTPLPTLYGFQDPTTVEMAMALHTAGAGGTDTLIYRETMLRALTAHILQYSSSASSENSPHLSVDDPRLQRALDFIEANLSETMSLDDMASAAAVSPFHFARSFKKAVGQSPHKYVTARRLQLAQHLLKTTSDPVEVIAARAGWQNKSHFSAAFKRATGLTPGAYRVDRS